MSRGFLSRVVLVNLTLLAAIAGGAAAQTGAAEGRVTSLGTGRPIAGVQVFVAGTSLVALTDDAGMYRLTGVPARQVDLRTRFLGHSPQSKSVVVTAGGTARADFELQPSAVQLEEVVVTGTGQRVETKRLGNTVAVIVPPQAAPVSDISTLLQGREPGVTAISTNGLTGEGARILSLIHI